MKTLARFGAILSFACFFFAGVRILALATSAGPYQPLVIVLGLCLLGVAFFLGPILWLAGEKWGANGK